MFVWKSKYNKLRSEYDQLLTDYRDSLAKRLSLLNKYNNLEEEWTDLVNRINAKGGEAFLDSEPTQFSQEDIKKILLLCHPDKHDGKVMAQEITQKLLKMRK